MVMVTRVVWWSVVCMSVAGEVVGGFAGVGVVDEVVAGGGGGDEGGGGGVVELSG